uniref:Uncharacterized protein n=1 Tax=Globisporangium ultimum (strain ATCC 200006 / CBS 805.95 / DAOM BR144) TaxID=431595 RepID=K3WT34_GLOUD
MADAIPILSVDGECHDDMGDDPILADPFEFTSSRRYHAQPPRLFPRRKRPHSSKSAANAALFTVATRRRGSSVPCDLRDDEQQQHFPVETRVRAGSAGPPHVRGSHLKDGGRPVSRRRAMSGLLKPFRRRKEAEVAYSTAAAAPRAKRRVTFKTTLHADVMPNPWGYQVSYDELLFTVGGLYQTLSYLHDPVETTEAGATDPSSSDAPLERSMLLMIAEFLYRAGVYLGYVAEDGDDGCKPWIPGFRESKRFSINDVKRWRRLAHHDWESEEREFAKHAAHARQTKEKSGGLRATVSHWIQRRRRHSAPAKLATTLPFPPPVSKTRDLSRLVAIANSCISCGAFQFTAQDILQLCNVDIETKLANLHQ